MRGCDPAVAIRSTPPIAKTKRGPFGVIPPGHESGPAPSASTPKGGHRPGAGPLSPGTVRLRHAHGLRFREMLAGGMWTRALSRPARQPDLAGIRAASERDDQDC